MKIVVDISDSTIHDLKNKQNRTEVDNAVLNGIPLTLNDRDLEPKNLCEVCVNDACMFQSGIVRESCAFYKEGRKTNGEKFKEIFGEFGVALNILNKSWWDRPYQKPCLTCKNYYVSQTDAKYCAVRTCRYEYDDSLVGKEE